MISHHIRYIMSLCIVAVLSNNIMLYAAADTKINVERLEPRVSFFVLPYMKIVDYYLGDSKVGMIKYEEDTVGYISRIKVKKEFRLQGVGGYMLKRAIEDLTQAGYTEIQLSPSPFEAPVMDWTREREKLISFYQKHGFQVTNPFSKQMHLITSQK